MTKTKSSAHGDKPPKPKKQKAGSAAAKNSDTPALPGGNPLDIVNPKLLIEESRRELREQYQNAEPYLHCVMRDLFDPAALMRVRDEIINNIQATFKETDLFKVFQTGDLANLDKLDKSAADKLPTLMALKAAVYSDEFRAFVREVTGCGELADKTDTSCNIYAQGGHLLCHDDVIGTRRVSWIIYLTDPERPWTAEDGGALELYPLEQGQKHTPTVHPTVAHLPTFNTMAMFTVLPGKSFHAVQEVVSDDKPRLSISGWYHAPTEPEDRDKASLQQLQSGANPLLPGQDNCTADQYEPFSTGEHAANGAAGNDNKANDTEIEGLSENDTEYLKRYINPAYLSPQSWSKIQERFKEEGSMQLQKFLSKEWSDRIYQAIKAADTANTVGNNTIPAYEAGLQGGWQAVGPPHKQRYLRYTASHSETSNGHETDAGSGAECRAAGALLAQVRDELFRSAPFQRLLRCFTTLNMVGQRGEARRFRPGLDYTVAHYGILTKDPRLDVVLSFVDEGEGESVWAEGEVGGYEAYLLADEDQEGAAAAEVYRQDAEDSGVLNVEAGFNSLNLVLRDEGLMKFVKYVSAAAPGSRWDIAMEYLPEEDSDSEEEDDKEPAAAPAAHANGAAAAPATNGVSQPAAAPLTPSLAPPKADGKKASSKAGKKGKGNEQAKQTEVETAQAQGTQPEPASVHDSDSAQPAAEPPTAASKAATAGKKGKKGKTNSAAEPAAPAAAAAAAAAPAAADQPQADDQPSKRSKKGGKGAEAPAGGSPSPAAGKKRKAAGDAGAGSPAEGGEPGRRQTRHSGTADAEGSAGQGEQPKTKKKKSKA